MVLNICLSHSYADHLTPFLPSPLFLDSGIIQGPNHDFHISQNLLYHCLLLSSLRLKQYTSTNGSHHMLEKRIPLQHPSHTPPWNRV